MPLIKISIPSMLQKFHACTDDYISKICHGRCCESTGGIKVVVSDSETKRIESLGATVKNNFIIADSRNLCPFKTDDGFCSIHFQKPFGCKASPFILSKRDVLIVRNRYRLLRCYNAENSRPAYLAHRWSLIEIFGEPEYEKLVQGIETRNNNLFANLEQWKYDVLKENAVNRKIKCYTDTK